jgi:lysophospholipase L1-like esterase
MERPSKIVILSDSLLMYVAIPDLAELHALHGATISTLIRGVQRNWFLSNWNDYDLVIIHCGTNDVGNGNQRHILSLTQFLIREIKQRKSSMRIIISAILPQPIDFNSTNPIITRVNQVIKIWAASQANVHYLPTYRTFIRQNQLRRNQNLFELIQAINIFICICDFSPGNLILCTGKYKCKCSIP